MTQGESGGGHPETGEPPPATPTLSARLGADVIDLFLLAFTYVAVSFAVAAVAIQFGFAEGFRDTELRGAGTAMVAANIAVNVVFQLGYWAVVEGRGGSSLGKRLTGLRVVRSDGTPIGWRTAVARKVPFYAPFVLGWVPVISRSVFLVMLLLMAAGLASYVADRPHLRGFHDRLASTRVVPTGE
ncbi:MAG: RDD family protein [Actinobacteria bacterium]|nr:RDD family protein [Actinomycetota bacterium]